MGFKDFRQLQNQTIVNSNVGEAEKETEPRKTKLP